MGVAVKAHLQNPRVKPKTLVNGIEPAQETDGHAKEHQHAGGKREDVMRRLVGEEKRGTI